MSFTRCDNAYVEFVEKTIRSLEEAKLLLRQHERGIAANRGGALGILFRASIAKVCGRECTTAAGTVGNAYLEDDDATILGMFEHMMAPVLVDMGITSTTIDTESVYDVSKRLIMRLKGGKGNDGKVLPEFESVLDEFDSSSDTSSEWRFCIAVEFFRTGLLYYRDLRDLYCKFSVEFQDDSERVDVEDADFKYYTAHDLDQLLDLLEIYNTPVSRLEYTRYSELPFLKCVIRHDDEYSESVTDARVALLDDQIAVLGRHLCRVRNIPISNDDAILLQLFRAKLDPDIAVDSAKIQLLGWSSDLQVDADSDVSVDAVVQVYRDWKHDATTTKHDGVVTAAADVFGQLDNMKVVQQKIRSYNVIQTMRNGINDELECEIKTLIEDVDKELQLLDVNALTMSHKGHALREGLSDIVTSSSGSLAASGFKDSLKIMEITIEFSADVLRIGDQVSDFYCSGGAAAADDTSSH